MPNTLFDDDAVQAIIRRLRSLTPKSSRIWGKMTVAQMLAHLSVGLEMAVGDIRLKQGLFGKIFARFARESAFGDKPIARNLPTGPEFIIKDDRDLDVELRRLLTLIDRFATGGPEKCTTAPHAFFGRLTPEEWSRLQWKHIDHHLRQFGA